MPKPLSHRECVKRALAFNKLRDWKSALDAWLKAAESAGRYDDTKREMCNLEAVRVFDKLYPAGAKVEFWPMAREGDGRIGHTKGAPYMLCGTAMIGIEGFSGGIALTHVRVIAVTEGPCTTSL